MGKFVWRCLCPAVAMLVVGILAGCASRAKSTPLFPGKINLTPGGNTSIEQGNTLSFTASVQTETNVTLNVPITFSSSDTSILNLAPNGFACAGHWDAAFTTCTPGNSGAVQVTASALGATSVPTYVFVHPPIDNISVMGVLLDGVPVQEPCLSQSQSMTLEAHAFGNGTDITSSVGPFTWSANNTSVATLNPIVNSAYNFPTNQVTATALNPGITHIYASASGVSSNSFQQPRYNNGTSPVLDFFATCPIQSIDLELGRAGSGQTSFVVNKGTGQTAVATITDVMGNSTLPNTNGGIVLSKIPLTWTASQPAVLAAGASCTESCALSTVSLGSGSVSASCSPPTCNIGFPEVPASLSSMAQRDACTKFFEANAPPGFSCSQLIPAPVYAPTAITGTITGTPSSPAVLAASLGCAHEPPSTCKTSVYQTGKIAGNENPLPVAPNSFLFDLAGDKLYMGSDFGALIINPGNFGSSNSPFTSLGTVTGKILAASANGSIPIFSDTVHSPNQVYVINAGNPIALNIPAAIAAAFSPDNLKAFILANSGTTLYIYSPLQALQGPISLVGTGNAVAFSPNSAFAFVAEKTGSGGGPNLTAFANCSNAALAPIQPVAAVSLPANPILMKVLPNAHIDGRDSYGNLIPDGVHILVLDASGFDVITVTISGSSCPQSLAFVSGDPNRAVQRIELGQGTLRPLNFFASADASQFYVVSSNSSSILVYNAIAGSVIGGIELLNNALPVSADMAVDAGTIVIGGSDDMVHEVSTSLGGEDLLQISFPNLPNYLNAFCTFSPSAGPCTLTTVLAKP